MRAISAFLNGAGSRRYLKGGSADRGLLKLLDLFVITGVASELPLRIRAKNHPVPVPNILPKLTFLNPLMAATRSGRSVALRPRLSAPPSLSAEPREFI